MAVIEIIPKTKFIFRGEINQTQQIILKDRVPTDAFVSAVLLVRGHERLNFSVTLSVTAQVFNVSESREDKGVSFVGTTDLVSTITAITNSAPTVPFLIVKELASPLGSMVRVQLNAAQLATAGGNPQELTISVDLVGRER